MSMALSFPSSAQPLEFMEAFCRTTDYDSCAKARQIAPMLRDAVAEFAVADLIH